MAELPVALAAVPQLVASSMRTVGRPTHYATGDTLVRQHELANSVILIERGLAVVDSADESGRRTVLALRGRGELIGEFAAITNRPRSATVRAATELSATIVPAKRFQLLMRNEPKLAFLVLQRLVLRIHESDRRRIEAGTYHIAARLARLLLELAELHGTSTNEQTVEINRLLTQHEMASAIGASRESVSRAMTALRDEGIVRTARRRVVILRMQALVDHAWRYD